MKKRLEQLFKNYGMRVKVISKRVSLDYIYLDNVVSGDSVDEYTIIFDAPFIFKYGNGDIEEIKDLTLIQDDFNYFDDRIVSPNLINDLKKLGF